MSAAVATTLASLPDPVLRAVDNQTPFRIFQCDKMAPGRRFFDVVAVKGTFELNRGAMKPSETVTPFRMSDEPWDLEDAERSSLRYAGDLLLAKPTTDITFAGSVFAPREEPRDQWDVAVVVRNERESLIRHVTTVTGPRQHQYSYASGWVLSDPAKVHSVPIRWELAYGGPRDGSLENPGLGQGAAFLANPSGVGEVLRPDNRKVYPAAQWHLPDERVAALNQPIAPVGLGPVARHWSSRSRLAGTYDQEWKRNARTGFLDYPHDLDLRFFQCAPQALQCPRFLRGNEWLGIYNGARDSDNLATQLPGIAVLAHLETRSKSARVRLPLDTVHVDLEKATVDLVWRLSLDQALGVERCTLGCLRGGS